MNKTTTFILLKFLFCLTVKAQTKEHSEKYKNLEPDVWMGIFDKINSSKQIKFDTIGYNEIPKNLDFRGTVVEVIKWNDSTGENILVQSVTGHFLRKEYYDKDSTKFDYQDIAEIYAYLFSKAKTETEYKQKWKIYDYIDCFGVDLFAGFIPKATTITDLDNDGITEITIPYVLICRGGMDPGSMKIIMYEDRTKFALRGSTQIMCEGKNPYGGEYTESENLKGQITFKDFLIKHWNKNKCEKGKYY